MAAAPLQSVDAFIAVRFAAEVCAKDRCVPHTVRQQVLDELRGMPLYQVRGWSVVSVLTVAWQALTLSQCLTMT